MADIIKMMIDGIGDMTAKILGTEREKEIVMFTEESNSHDLYTVLAQFVDEGRYCEAEDLLFEELDKGFTEGKYLAGVEFYEMLKETDKDLLKAGNFPYSEIADGICALNKCKETHTGIVDEELIDQIAYEKITPNFPKKKKGAGKNNGKTK